MRRLTQRDILGFVHYLRQEEKSEATVDKYLRDAQVFARFVGSQEVTKEQVVAFKASLQEQGYAIRSINSMLASCNSLLRFLGWEDCKTKILRQQKQTYCTQDKELTREEYLRLLKAAESRPQLGLLLQTICGTGIRVSELRYFTVEAVNKGEVQISCKGKNRVILLPEKLRTKLLKYAKRQQIQSGAIFVTSTGRPLDRHRIWALMKKLCVVAGVAANKVFPHNLRKLFARCFYRLEKDIARLADILGHSSIDTTRIYIMTTGAEHRQKLAQMRLIL